MLRRVAVIVFVTLLSLAASEAFLRAFHHQVLPAAVSNEVANGYRTGFEGIYYFAHHLAARVEEHELFSGEPLEPVVREISRAPVPELGPGAVP